MGRSCGFVARSLLLSGRDDRPLARRGVGTATAADGARQRRLNGGAKRGTLCGRAGGQLHAKLDASGGGEVRDLQGLLVAREGGGLGGDLRGVRRVGRGGDRSSLSSTSVRHG